MNDRVFRFLPQIDMEEAMMVDRFTHDLNDNDMQRFAAMYSTRRKDAQMILLMALIGFLGLSGVHRFVMGQIGMGVLYLFTVGLCFIGTIVDLVNHRQLTLEHNTNMAQESIMILKSFR